MGIKSLRQERSKRGKRAKNTEGYGTGIEGAINLTEQFHGRPHKNIEKYTETHKYRGDLGILGYLIDLELVEGGGVIVFFDIKEKPNGDITNMPTERECKNMIRVTATPSGTQIYFERGNQKLDLNASIFNYLSSTQKRKDYVDLGEVQAISYFTDKHHLSDPGQEDGIVYRHELGESGGELPVLVYDKLNERLMFVGGDYEIRPEGIAN